MQCDSSQPEVSEIKAEHNELEIPQTEEPLPVKQEEVLETVRIKQEPPEVEFEHMEPVKEESEDFKPNIPELEPVCLRECSVVLERICVREQGSPNSMQGGGKEDGRSHSECSLAEGDIHRFLLNNIVCCIRVGENLVEREKHEDEVEIFEGTNEPAGRSDGVIIHSLRADNARERLKQFGIVTGNSPDDP
ncbi:hypothetical protein EOD39_19165 [Acipenser ruthenus]|uniref:Uncharacterized protein n=1 Tax=Acipenser ruthenus TaxID=7906 RepID=A0A444UYW2_ACIRT|nr:hypothetical protein EOD39_19165 [Acipenser ruthenus]